MPELTDPIAAFHAAVEVLDTENWSAAADVVDPISLRVFANQLRAQIAPEGSPRTATADDYIAADPKLSRSLAEHYAEQARRHADPASRLERELPTVDSVESFRALSPEQILAAWLDGRSMRRQVERLAADGQISADVAALRASAGFAMHRYVPIGALPDGPDIAHVLYRRDSDPSQPWSDEAGEWLANRPEDEQKLARDLWVYGHPSVATMRRQPDETWRLVLEHDFLNVSKVHLTGIGIKRKTA